MARTPKIRGLRLFSATGAVAQHPVAEVSVPADWKMIGGGARVNWGGAGNLLTASYPSDFNTWSAAAKDHIHVSPADITVWAFAIWDPDNEFETVIDAVQSGVAAHPSATAPERHGFQLVGGGASADWDAAGQLLFASHPVGTSAWQAASKDHVVSDPDTVTAYALCLRPRNGSRPIPVMVQSVTSAVAQHPFGTCAAPAGCRLIGGGARVNWKGAGNLLTGSYPENDAWAARAKDHDIVSPASITVYALGIQQRYFGR